MDLAGFRERHVPARVEDRAMFEQSVWDGSAPGDEPGLAPRWHPSGSGLHSTATAIVRRYGWSDSTAA